MVEKFEISSFLSAGLKQLEKYLYDFTHSLEGRLKRGVSNTLLAGGKRIRPALFLICAKNSHYDLDYLLPAAAAIEIIHTASLIHDDIIDRSSLRRGNPTIHHLYDNDNAKYIGNYLFTHTFSLLNSYNRPQILKQMCSAAEHLVRGEFDQLKQNQKLDQGESYYFDMIDKKTSSLFKACCVLGGILSDSSPGEINSLGKFGKLLGIAFQINDDLLDIDVKESQDIGKPIGNDLRQGNLTLPVIYALKNRQFRQEAAKIWGCQPLSESNISKILTMIKHTQAVDITRAKLNYYIQEAKKAISGIGGAERRENMLKVLDYFKS